MILFVFGGDIYALLSQMLISVILSLIFFTGGIQTLRYELEQRETDVAEIKGGLQQIWVGVIFLLLGWPAWIGGIVCLIIWGTRIVLAALKRIR